MNYFVMFLQLASLNQRWKQGRKWRAAVWQPSRRSHNNRWEFLKIVTENRKERVVFQEKVSRKRSQILLLSKFWRFEFQVISLPLKNLLRLCLDKTKTKLEQKNINLIHLRIPNYQIGIAGCNSKAIPRL